MIKSLRLNKKLTSKWLQSQSSIGPVLGKKNTFQKNKQTYIYQYGMSVQYLIWRYD